MVLRLFFPGRLHPVLDGGVGHEDAVVAPEVPRGLAVGEAILGHQADGKVLHAFGVQALGRGQVGHVDGETEVAVRAVMFGIEVPKHVGICERAPPLRRSGSPSGW